MGAGPSGPGGVSAERARYVREMFDRISRRYELLNLIMTAGMHRRWNSRVIEVAGLEGGERVLDLACGTGSLSRDLARAVGPYGYVLGVDFSAGMLRLARRRMYANLEYRLGDATDLKEVESRSFDVATIAYGARNIPDLAALFSEMRRCLKPGGRAVCLEIARPEGVPARAFYGVWFDRIVPLLGGMISGDREAYAYLPRSVKEFVAPAELAGIMERSGLRNVTWERLAGGIITLHSGTKPR
ncbi:ubiquinone/menaquinone biosynthesis methyltransferase [Rubrobacter calidifluminis]|uniref:ubiquinone/menaquinone biosynthesis methyltransferase n=1 Tax=Rubrobacter calidifluminis TaxID=1392640 RepID=UPI002362657F|nr:ubiquinone/menaquinone biosynthesis methyltransferase [Rubrobacter calidifluminis]